MLNLHEEWRSADNFSDGNKNWAVLNSSGTRESSLEEVTLLSKKWNFLKNDLFCSPKTGRFLPPIFIDEISEQVYRNIKLKFRPLIYVSIYTAIIFLFFAIFSRANHITTIKISAVILSINLLIFSEYKFSIGKIDVLKERILFFIYIKKRHKMAFLVFILMLATGAIQLGLMLMGVASESLIIEIGAYYSAVDNGEYWRLISGPFIHSSAQHWASNFIFFIGIAFFIPDNQAVKYFILSGLAAIISAAAAYIVSHKLSFNSGIEAFAGVSGACYFILGLLVSDSLLSKNEYPRYFYFSLIIYVFILFILPAASVNSTSNVAHMAGFFIGLMIMSFFHLQSKFSNLAHSSVGQPKE